MSRVNKFKRYYQHEDTGRITAICWGNIDNNDNAVHDFSVFKSPSTISRWYPIADCQFTGLLDKNGKEVFESDIIKRTADMRNYAECDGVKVEIYTVEYFKSRLYPFYDTSEYMEEYEVIGNIYENPELL